MTDFIEKEKNKLKKFEEKLTTHHKEKEDEKKNNKAPKFYRNLKTGAIISADEYESMFLTEESNLTMGMSTNGVIGMAPIMEDEYIHSDDTYVPYVPEEGEEK